jgi:hypothetical protein
MSAVSELRWSCYRRSAPGPKRQRGGHIGTATRYPGNGCARGYIPSLFPQLAQSIYRTREKFLLEDNMDMTTLLIIVVVLLLFGGGGYYGFRRRG